MKVREDGEVVRATVVVLEGIEGRTTMVGS
jgi:hypothetical protein